MNLTFALAFLILSLVAEFAIIVWFAEQASSDAIAPFLGERPLETDETLKDLRDGVQAAILQELDRQNWQVKAWSFAGLTYLLIWFYAGFVARASNHLDMAPFYAAACLLLVLSINLMSILATSCALIGCLVGYYVARRRTKAAESIEAGGA